MTSAGSIVRIDFLTRLGLKHIAADWVTLMSHPPIHRERSSKLVSHRFGETCRSARKPKRNDATRSEI